MQVKITINQHTVEVEIPDSIFAPPIAPKEKRKNKSYTKIRSIDPALFDQAAQFAQKGASPRRLVDWFAQQGITISLSAIARHPLIKAALHTTGKKSWQPFAQ